MSLVRLLATSLLAAQARRTKERVEAHVTAAATKAVAGLVAATLALMAVAFAALAVFLRLDRTLPAPVAALWVAGGLLVLALAAWLVGSLRARSRMHRQRRLPTPQPAAAPVADPAGDALDAGRHLGATAAEALARHPQAAMGTAFVAGLALALLVGRGKGGSGDG
jgi:small neutral amino acid transporter SnatA (MarC family)